MLRIFGAIAIVLVSLAASAQENRAGGTGKPGGGIPLIPGTPGGSSGPAGEAADPGDDAASEAPAGADAGSAVRQSIGLEEVATLLQDAGYRARIVRDQGDPYVESRAGGLSFWIYVYECGAAFEACRYMHLQTSFQATAEQQAKALQWNSDKVLGRAYSSGGSAYIDMAIDLNGGVTEANLRNAVESFETRMSEFTDYIGWQ